MQKGIPEIQADIRHAIYPVYIADPKTAFDLFIRDGYNLDIDTETRLIESHPHLWEMFDSDLKEIIQKT